MTNSELLHRAAKETPTDRTLLGAWADSLEEDGDSERAGWVRELIAHEESWRNPRPHRLDEAMKWNLTRWRLLDRLGLQEPVRAGTWVTYDSEGRVVPFRPGYHGSPVVGTVSRVFDDGTVEVAFASPWSGYHGRLEVCRSSSDSERSERTTSPQPTASL